MDEKMKNIGLLTEYENILLKKKKDFSPAYMRASARPETAAVVFRFAFEELLQWTPEMIRDYTTPKLIQALHLKKALNRVVFPPELNKRDDLFYIACMLYPDIICYSKKILTLRVYEKVLNGILAKFPKGFFSESEGCLNANICLQYAINQELRFHSISELYSFFSNKEKVIPFLKKAKLYAACVENYEYPIDMLHDSLPESVQDELLYYLGRFTTDFKYTKERVRKNESNN